MPEITLRGAAVAFREDGADRPGVPVLLAHCSLAHSGLWKPILAALAETRPVIALDMPAHGGSSPPPEGESLQLFARDACAALAERFGRPAHLVGLSLGGATLGRLAIARPDLAASLSLLEPVWFHLLDASKAQVAGEQDFNLRMRTLGEAGDWRGAVKLFVETWGAPGGFEALGEKGQAHAMRALPALVADFEMVSGHPPGQIEREDIARIAAPAMLIQGETTDPKAKAALDEIEACLPRSRRRQIAGAGHLSPVTHPQAVLTELQSFFAQAEAPASAA
ncbi:MAG: alpha/beta fold hydrolase [Pseudomonadota bacterium]